MTRQRTKSLQCYTLFSDKREIRSHVVFHAATGYWPKCPDKVIHHIDENPFNNELSNLQLMSRAEHQSLHISNLSEKTRVKMRAVQMGEKNPRWKGDDAKPQSKYVRKWRAQRRRTK